MEQTLLMVFIGLVALALVGIALSIGSVAWFIVKLLRELNSIAEDVHEAGKVVTSDLNELRGEIRREGFKAKMLFQMLAKIFTQSTRKARTVRKEPGEGEV